MGDDFMAVAFGIQRGADPALMRLRFVDPSGAELAVIVRTDSLPLILREVQSQTLSADVVPINRGTLAASGVRSALRGHTVAVQPDGSAEVTLMFWLEPEGRMVTLPWSLSPAERRYLADDLGREA